jgi:hypothetical protein
MARTSDLSVRQHERHACDVPVRIFASGATADIVRLTRVGAEGAAVRIVDYSKGGIGLRSPFYFPLTGTLRLRLMTATATIEVDLRVQRVSMVDRTPAYYVGTSFDASHPSQQDAAASLLAALRAIPLARGSSGPVPDIGLVPPSIPFTPRTGPLPKPPEDRDA